LSDVLYTSLAHWLKSAKTAAPLLIAPAQPAEPALKVETSVIDVVDVVDVIATNAALPNFDLPGFDIPMALARVNNNWPMLEKFLRMFRERNANSLSEIGTALTNQDLTAAKRLAHTLKGVAATLGAVTLAEAASRFESALVAAGHSQAESDSAKPDDFAEDFAALDAEWRQTLTTLDTFLESTTGKTS
jgi:HPt (histidine-containing phosphotransfer) domain-containing protein